jgi:hypothetical protein
MTTTTTNEARQQVVREANRLLAQVNHTTAAALKADEELPVDVVAAVMALSAWARHLGATS